MSVLASQAFWNFLLGLGLARWVKVGCHPYYSPETRGQFSSVTWGPSCWNTCHPWGRLVPLPTLDLVSCSRSWTSPQELEGSPMGCPCPKARWGGFWRHSLSLQGLTGNAVTPGSKHPTSRSTSHLPHHLSLPAQPQLKRSLSPNSSARTGWDNW